MKRWLTYANVVSTLALFITLGGTAYAAIQITTSQIKDNTILSRDIHSHTVGYTDITYRSIWGGVHIHPESLTKYDLAPGAVGESEMQSNSVNSSALQDNSVDQWAIQDGAITCTDLSLALQGDVGC
jgi:hypothetical protein